MAYLKLLIAKLRHEQFGASSERGRKLLDQLELQLEEVQAAAAEERRRWMRTRQGSRSVARPTAGRCAGRCRRICRVSAW